MGNASDKTEISSNSPLVKRDAIVKIGWLIKQGEVRKNWNKRYCVLLSHKKLLYFTDSNCVEYRGTADFRKVKDISIAEKPQKFSVTTPNRKWIFEASTIEDARDWLRQIRYICEFNVQGEKQRSSSQFRREISLVRGGIMGWLTKKGELRHSWNQRWTILLPSRLIIYFTDKTCNNFKGTGDFRDDKIGVEFDKEQKLLFNVQTPIRVWQFKCYDENEVQEWCSQIQYLMEKDKSTLVFRLMDDENENKNKKIETPDSQLIKTYFKNLTIFKNDKKIVKEIEYYEKPYQIFVLIFEKEDYLTSILNMGRTHLIVDKVSKDNNFLEKTHTLFALKFSEFLGGVFDGFKSGVDSDTQKTYTSKVHRLSKVRTSKVTTRNKSRSITFHDKNQMSAVDYIRKRYEQQKKLENTTNNKLKRSETVSKTVTHKLNNKLSLLKDGNEEEEESKETIQLNKTTKINVNNQNSINYNDSDSDSIPMPDDLEEQTSQNIPEEVLNSMHPIKINDDWSDEDLMEGDYKSHQDKLHKKSLNREKIFDELKSAPVFKQVVRKYSTQPMQVEEMKTEEHEIDKFLNHMEKEMGSLEQVARYVVTTGGKVDDAYVSFRRETIGEESRVSQSDSSKPTKIGSYDPPKLNPRLIPNQKSLSISPPTNNGVKQNDSTRLSRGSRTKPPPPSRTKSKSPPPTIPKPKPMQIGSNNRIKKINNSDNSKIESNDSNESIKSTQSTESSKSTESPSSSGIKISTSTKNASQKKIHTKKNNSKIKKEHNIKPSIAKSKVKPKLKIKNKPLPQVPSNNSTTIKNEENKNKNSNLKSDKKLNNNHKNINKTPTNKLHNNKVNVLPVPTSGKPKLRNASKKLSKKRSTEVDLKSISVTLEKIKPLSKLSSETVIKPDTGIIEINRKSVWKKYTALDLNAESQEEKLKRERKEREELLMKEQLLNDKTKTSSKLAKYSKDILHGRSVSSFSPDFTSSTSFDFTQISNSFEVGSCVIIDSGSGYIKAGFENDNEPISIPTVVAKKSKYSKHTGSSVFHHSSHLSSSNENNLHFGDDPLTSHSASMYGDLSFPIERDKIKDFDTMTQFWEHIIYKKLGVEDIYDHPLILTEPPGNSSNDRRKMLMHAFEDWSVPKFYLFNTALANFYYTGKSRDDFAVIVDSGHGTTNISCMYLGMFLTNYAARLNLGGKDITEYLSTLMAHESIYFHLDTGYKIASKIKEKLCYISNDYFKDYEKELNYFTNKQIFSLPDGRQLKIGKETFEAPELLFSPNDPMHEKGLNKNKSSHRALHTTIVECVNQLDDDDVEKDMYSNIICCGGTANLPNFSNRLRKELSISLSRRMSIMPTSKINNAIKVKVVRKPQFSAWYGSQMVQSLSTFSPCWITRDDYDEHGHNIFIRKCNHQDL